MKDRSQTFRSHFGSSIVGLDLFFVFAMAANRDKKDKKKLRAKRVDVSDKDAAVLFREHMKVDDSKDPMGRLWAYKSKKLKGGIDWADISRHRFFLNDLIRLTNGNLLRHKKWESQLRKFFDQSKISATEDELTAIAYRPRHMFSHLRRAKIDSRKVPDILASKVSFLLTAMQMGPRNPCVGDGDNDSDELPESETNSNDDCEVLATPVKKHVDTVDLLGDDDDDDDDELQTPPKTSTGSVSTWIDDRLDAMLLPKEQRPSVAPPPQPLVAKQSAPIVPHGRTPQTPQKATTIDISRSTLVEEVGDEDINAMMNDPLAHRRGPTMGEYETRRKKIKSKQKDPNGKSKGKKGKGKVAKAAKGKKKVKVAKADADDTPDATKDAKEKKMGKVAKEKTGKVAKEKTGKVANKKTDKAADDIKLSEIAPTSATAIEQVSEAFRDLFRIDPEVSFDRYYKRVHSRFWHYARSTALKRKFRIADAALEAKRVAKWATDLFEKKWADDGTGKLKEVVE